MSHYLFQNTFNVLGSRMRKENSRQCLDGGYQSVTFFKGYRWTGVGQLQQGLSFYVMPKFFTLMTLSEKTYKILNNIILQLSDNYMYLGLT